MNELLNKWIEILKLKDWDIQLIEEQTLNSSAGTKIIYNDYKAIVKIKAELSQEEKEKSLIHELLHLIHRDEYDLVTDLISDYQQELYMRFHERNIEKVAQILYSLYHSEGVNENAKES